MDVRVGGGETVVCSSVCRGAKSVSSAMLTISCTILTNALALLAQQKRARSCAMCLYQSLRRTALLRHFIHHIAHFDDHTSTNNRMALSWTLCDQGHRRGLRHDVLGVFFITLRTLDGTWPNTKYMSVLHRDHFFITIENRVSSDTAQR